jgi:hypothetical protein
VQYLLSHHEQASSCIREICRRVDAHMRFWLVGGTAIAAVITYARMAGDPSAFTMILCVGALCLFLFGSIVYFRLIETKVEAVEEAARLDGVQSLLTEATLVGSAPVGEENALPRYSGEPFSQNAAAVLRLFAVVNSLFLAVSAAALLSARAPDVGLGAFTESLADLCLYILVALVAFTVSLGTAIGYLNASKRRALETGREIRRAWARLSRRGT